MRGIGGSSSGAIAAFMVAWERPDAFHKVLSNVGSFTDIRGVATRCARKPCSDFCARHRKQSVNPSPQNVSWQTVALCSAGGHAYPDIVRQEPSTKDIRVFLCDGRNDNRSLDADGSYNQDRDWFYQNVRMQQALEGMFADDVNAPRWAYCHTDGSVFCRKGIRPELHLGRQSARAEVWGRRDARNDEVAVA